LALLFLEKNAAMNNNSNISDIVFFCRLVDEKFYLNFGVTACEHLNLLNILSLLDFLHSQFKIDSTSTTIT